MAEYQRIIIIYLLVINIATFFTYGIDKWKAKKSKWRIREVSLLTLAVLGGSIGAWLGMKVWHHKTMHKKFKYGVPAILILQLALLAYIICSCQIDCEHHPVFEKNKPLILLKNNFALWHTIAKTVSSGHTTTRSPIRC
jgi:uncharacterized membrane protein YsdA (DUF1294 family)